jgi:uncharacterized protein
VTDEAFDGWVRTSEYVPVRDGVRLAVDVFRPTSGGQLHGGPLPVVYTHKRYQRAVVKDGVVQGVVRDPAEGLLPMHRRGTDILRHGYVVAASDMRGAGSSFGSRSGPYKDMCPAADGLDGYDIIEWLAVQPWCDGNVGMFGASYEGRIQYDVAATAPPHLRAIAPEFGPLDWYFCFVRGGINWDYEWPGPGDRDPVNAPVDEDEDGSMLALALKEHEANPRWTLEDLPYRNSWDTDAGRAPHIDNDGLRELADIKQSGIAVYHQTGWWNINPKWHTLAAYRQLEGTPQKLIIGGWGGGGAGDLWTSELLRFFDHWLKGVDNGVMDGPPVFYYTTHAPAGDEWRTSWTWPLPGEIRTDFYLDGARSGSVASVNDGTLSASMPAQAQAADSYTVDYTAAPGRSNRTIATIPGPHDEDWTQDMDEKGLTYTTAPLASDVEVTGHPVVQLWVSSSASDGDFFVVLEDVSEDGKSSYVTDGRLRASHRATATPHFDNLGIPWHRSYKEDMLDIPAGEAVELSIEMLPVSYVFRRGRRMRVTVVCAWEGFVTPVLDPAPRVTVHRDTAHPSRITLPVIEHDARFELAGRLGPGLIRGEDYGPMFGGRTALGIQSLRWEPR